MFEEVGKLLLLSKTFIRIDKMIILDSEFLSVDFFLFYDSKCNAMIVIFLHQILFHHIQEKPQCLIAYDITIQKKGQILALNCDFSFDKQDLFFWNLLSDTPKMQAKQLQDRRIKIFEIYQMVGFFVLMLVEVKYIFLLFGSKSQQFINNWLERGYRDIHFFCLTPFSQIYSYPLPSCYPI